MFKVYLKLIDEKLLKQNALFKILILAFIVTLPSLFNGFLADDYFHALVTRGEKLIFVPQNPLDIYNFVPQKGPAQDYTWENGSFPWFASKDLKVHFFRPLSALTHVIDYNLFWGKPILMHLHSIFWYLVLIIAVFFLFKLWMSEKSAALACLIFSLNSCHAFPIGWLANRNAIISSFFACLTLIFFIRFARENKRHWFWFCLLFYCLGLLAGELTVTVLLITLCYMLFPLKNDSRTLLSYLFITLTLVTIVYRFFYQQYGFGTYDSGLYLDPIQDFSEYFLQLPERTSMLIASALSPLTSDIWLLIPRWLRQLYIPTAIVSLFFFGKWGIMCLKRQQMKFYSLAFFLCLSPLVIAFPNDRMLIMVNLIVASFVATLLVKQMSPDGRLSFFHKYCIVIFLIIFPLMLPLKVTFPKFFNDAELSGLKIYKDNPQNLKTVLLNSPSPFFSLMAYRGNADISTNQNLQIVHGWNDFEFKVLGNKQISVKSEQGIWEGKFSWLWVDRSKTQPQGTIVQGAFYEIEIISILSDGRPKEIKITFDAPLNTYRWIKWDWDKQFAPYNIESQLKL